jgi:hypothetical protein
MIAIYNWKIPSTSTTEMRRAAWVSDGSATIEAVRVMGRVMGGNKISATVAKSIQYFSQPFPEFARCAPM